MAAQYERTGGEEKFLETLKANNVDPAFVKKMVNEDETIGRFLEKKVFAAIPVGEDELQKAYAEDKTATVRHILLMTQGKPESENHGDPEKDGRPSGPGERPARISPPWPRNSPRTPAPRKTAGFTKTFPGG